LIGLIVDKSGITARLTMESLDKLAIPALK
jgi:hypothetical protein